MALLKRRRFGEMVRRILNLDKIPESEDASDAIAAAVCHIHSAKVREG